MIEVFKTDVRERCQAEQVIRLLIRHFPGHKVNFDLEDCDRVLRMEGSTFSVSRVRNLVRRQGFLCQVLTW